ncbi:C39 family peptidase [Deinococcus sp.]|uniref:C39 family peptidase n=1 Tax=Deinococcus sp. TaxID=47478 RepID=UPI0025FE6955|nr:C39 family peptidase [Deinococcus sp.]
MKKIAHLGLSLLLGASLLSGPPSLARSAQNKTNTIQQRTALQRSVQPPPTLPTAVQLNNLGFVYQTYNNCGPAALVSVLGAYGLRADQAALAAELRPGGGYMTADVIDPFLRPLGLRATRFRSGQLGHLKSLIRAGYPVVVLQWMNQVGAVPHFRVVRGFDDGSQRIFMSDPIYGPNVYLSYADFDRLWNVYGQEFIPVYPATDAARVARILGVRAVNGS